MRGTDDVQQKDPGAPTAARFISSTTAVRTILDNTENNPTTSSRGGIQRKPPIRVTNRQIPEG
jgi:hypothetical protein